MKKHEFAHLHLELQLEWYIRYTDRDGYKNWTWPNKQCIVSIGFPDRRVTYNIIQE